jgi:hypothetical protein
MSLPKGWSALKHVRVGRPQTEAAHQTAVKWLQDMLQNVVPKGKASEQLVKASTLASRFDVF